MSLLGIGGSRSSSSQQSTASGSSSGSSFIDQAQAPFLDFLRNTAMGSFGGFQQGAGQFGQGLQGLGQQSQQFGQMGMQNPFMAQMMQQAQGNPDLVAAQTQQLSGDLAQQFNEQINPAIGRTAAGLGQLGGGRQGVAQGAAIQGQQRALAQGALGFQQADVMRQLGAGQAGGQMFGAGIGQAMQGLGQQAGFMGQGFMAQFQPLQQLAALFGDPTVLSKQQAQNQSQSSGQSSSSSFNLGFG